MTPADRQRRIEAFEAWRTRYLARLEALPEPVRVELIATTLSRFLSGTHSGTTPQEIDDCRARAATRLRVQRYGRLPDDPVESRRQLEECRALCGLTTKPPVHGHVPAQAAE